MFTYNVHLEDGSDAGEATYAQVVKAGERVCLSGAEWVRVLDVVPIPEEDGSRFAGLLRVAPSSG